MTYARIYEERDLPAAGELNARSREKSDIDFKMWADPKDGPCHAKDIAAFANALGGVLIVGASDKSGQLRYPGLPDKQSPKSAIEVFEKAGAEMCSPQTQVNAVPITLASGKTIVAVNIDPSPDAFIASQSRHSHEDWTLPIRTSSQTKRLEPKDLAMYMNVSVRRAAILLDMIPVEARREVSVHFHTSGVWGRRMNGVPYQADGGLALQQRVLSLMSVDIRRNVVVFQESSTVDPESIHIPLRDVVDVWPRTDTDWAVIVAGTLMFGPGSTAYTPLPIR